VEQQHGWGHTVSDKHRALKAHNRFDTAAAASICPEVSRIMSRIMWSLGYGKGLLQS
jgi:hypothetical protein